MIKGAKISALFLIACLLWPQSSYACSAVLLKHSNDTFVGRTMDWKTGEGLVSINHPGESKKAAMIFDLSKKAEWKSVYGSITFDLTFMMGGVPGFFLGLFGKNKFSEPSCGLNEAGLYCGSFWVHPPPEVKYPKKDKRPTLNDWQLLEYILDSYGSVQEVVDNIGNIRVSGFKVGNFEADLHWFIADKSGDSAVIEFPNGELTIHHPASPPVITNSFYEHSREYVKNFAGFGGGEPIPVAVGEMTSENRFLFASHFRNGYLNKASLNVPDIFYLMEKVTQTNVRHASTSQALTQWTIVYDLNAGQIEWFTRANPEHRKLSLKEANVSTPGKAVRKSIDS